SIGAQGNQGFQGFQGFQGSVGAQGTVGAQGSVGAQGATGAQGVGGREAGIKYTYSNNTAASDPGSAKLKFDTPTFSSITSRRISENDADGNPIAALIQSWDDSTSAVRATIILVKDGTPSSMLAFQIAGDITDNGTWDSCTITYVTSSGTISNNDTVRLF